MPELEKPVDLGDARSEVEAYIIRLVDQAEDCRDTSWWEKVEKFHRNEPPSRAKGQLEPVHVPLSQPRQDAVAAQVCTVIGKQTPFMLSTGGDPSENQDKQNFLHSVLENAGFEEQLRKLARIATDTNLAILRVTPKIGPYGEDSSGRQAASTKGYRSGVCLDVIHPADFGIFPAKYGSVEKCSICYHRFYKRISEIELGKQTGLYYEDVPTPGADTISSDPTGDMARSRYPGDTPTGDATADGVECLYLWVKLDIDHLKDQEKYSEPKWYRGVFLRTSRKLLALYDANGLSPEYFEFRFIIEGLNFWPAVSIGRNLATLQDYYNNLASALYTGSMMACGRSIFGPPLDEKHSEVALFNEYIPYDQDTGAGQPWSATVTFAGQPLVIQMNMLERTADMVARISQNTMGQRISGVDTATENSIIAAGVQIGVEEYIANFSASLPRMGTHIWETLKTYAPAILPDYGIEPEKAAMLSTPTEWKPTGTSPTAIPRVRLEDAKMLFEMLASPLGQITGLDPYNLTKCIVSNSSLSGTEGIQHDKEELIANLQAALSQSQGSPDGAVPGGVPGVPGEPGMEMGPDISGQPVAGGA